MLIGKINNYIVRKVVTRRIEEYAKNKKGKITMASNKKIYVSTTTQTRKESSVKVYESDNYNEFKKMDENRTVNESHVENIKESMKKQYYVIPITVNEHMEIIDGQHRFTAASDLGLTIYYIMIHGLTAKDIPEMNILSKNWKKEDYLNFYISHKNETYIKFKNIMIEKNLTISHLLRIIFHATETCHTNLKSLDDSFVAGKLIISDTDEKKILDLLNEIEKIRFLNGVFKTNCIVAIVKLLSCKHFKMDEFKRKIEEKNKQEELSKEISLPSKSYQYLIEKMLEIYNTSRKKDDRLNYSKEADQFFRTNELKKISKIK